MSTTVEERSSFADDSPAGELSHKEILEVMTGLLAALFTALISSTIVSTALPTIMSDLHGTQRQYTWVITASLLAMTVTTPIWGKLSDLFNKKWLVQVSIVVFVLGSVGAGLSHAIWQMMACRAAQGVAMGGLTALVQSIMGTVIAPRQRGRYAGYMGGVMAVATVSGPLLGGVITDHLSWRWCFFVCVPLAVIALILLQITLKLPALQKRRVRIDYAGAVFLACAATAPMLWVTFAGQDFGWISWQSGAFLGSFVLAAGLAVWIELTVPEPIVPIRVLKNRTTALMIIASLAIGTAMFGAATFLTQYFQLAGGNSPTKAGLMTIPMILTQTVSAVVAGQIVSRTGRWKPVMLTGAVLMLIGLGGLGLTDHRTAYEQVAIFMAVMGLGIGPLIQNIVLAVQNTVDVKDVGASSATISFFRSVGGAVGVSVLGAVLANQVGGKIAANVKTVGGTGDAGGAAGGNLDIKDLPSPVQTIVHHAYGDSFGNLFTISAIVAIATLLAVILVREVPLRTTVAMQTTAGQAPITTSADHPAGEPAGPSPMNPQSPESTPNGSGPAAVNGHRRDHRLPTPPEKFAGNLQGLIDPADRCPPPAVLGTVRGAAGAPIQQAAVTLIAADGTHVGRGACDTAGRYRVPVPQAGSYLLIASARGHQPQAHTITVDSVPVQVEVSLVGTAHLTGTVLDTEGRPVHGAIVTLTDTVGELTDRQTTNSEGSYSFTAPAGDEYTLVISATGFRPVAEAVSTSGSGQNRYDIVLTHNHCRLAGTARSSTDGSPLAQARITLLDTDGNILAVTDTDHSGHYTIDDLPAGDYTVITTTYPPSSARIDLGAGADERCDLHLNHPPLAGQGTQTPHAAARRP